MIRFRLGQSWKRELPGKAEPRDAFALEVDGVNLLPPVNEEPLFRAVQRSLEAVCALVSDGDRSGQLSLEDVHVEVCFWRKPGLDVEVTIVDLRHPPRVLGRSISVDLSDLVDATIFCTRAFLKDVGRGPEVNSGDVAALEKRLKDLSSAIQLEIPSTSAMPWSVCRLPDTGLGFDLEDPDGRTMAWSRKTRAALPVLLLPGALRLPSGAPFKGPVFLMMMGLVRQATENRAVLGDQPLKPEDVFSAGLELCRMLCARNLTLAANPYVEGLHIRCIDGLTALKQPIPDATPSSPVPIRSRTSSTPLHSGSLRRMALSQKWTRSISLGGPPTGLVLGRSFVAMQRDRSLHLFALSGRSICDRFGETGVALAATGQTLTATHDRLAFFQPKSPNAAWIRSQSVGTLGQKLLVTSQAIIAHGSTRGLMALSPHTGRELWRVDPSRTQKLFWTHQGQRLLLGTDSGTISGIDIDDGQTRFQIRASLPCVGQAIFYGRDVLTILNRGEHTAILVCALTGRGKQRPAGTVHWTREVILANPCQPVSANKRVWIGGSRDSQTYVLCLGPRGQILWERTVPCDADTLCLLPFGDGVLAADARGVSVRILPEGQLDWILGASGDEIDRRIPMVISRQLLVIPGPITRIVQPDDGRIVTELETGAHLVDLRVDKKMNLFLCKASGVLEAWTPGTLLSLV